MRSSQGSIQISKIIIVCSPAISPNRLHFHVFYLYLFMISWVCDLSVYRGHCSLGVTGKETVSSGTKTDSPGFLRILAAFSRTCCSKLAVSGFSGGSGFTRVSPGSSSLCSSSSSSSSPGDCCLLFFCFFFAAF